MNSTQAIVAKYEEAFARTAEDIQGSCDMGGLRQQYLSHNLGIDVEDLHEDILDAFNEYCEERGIKDCDTCGWVMFEGEGNGDMCDDCLADEEEEDE